MAKNILIIPSNSLERTSDRVPYIDFLNDTTPISLKFTTASTLDFSSTTSDNVILSLSGRTTDNNVDVRANVINVHNNLTIGGIQVINATNNWVGPTTNILGAQGAQGATGLSASGTTTPIPPAFTVSLSPTDNVVYSSFGTKFLAEGFNSDGTGTNQFSYETALVGGTYTGTTWANPNSNLVDGPMNRCAVWHDDDSAVYGLWLGTSDCVSGLTEAKTYYIGVAADNNFRLDVDGFTIVNTTGGTLSGTDLVFKWWRVFPVVLSSGNHTINLYGKDDGAVGAFGCEIYNNTIQQLTAATSPNQLNIIFSTSAYTAAEIVQTGEGVYLSSGYTCPAGYVYSECGNLCIGYGLSLIHI